jgi:anti-sigma regulatory factor (Ser/Thr protein kinase)
MTEPAWEQRPRPVTGPGARPLARWSPAGLADLTAHRHRLAAELHGAARPPDADEGAVERLLLVFEELVSNALRHGRPPVRAEVTAVGTSWLLDVSDAAADRPPSLAVGRDAAHGGLGLYLVARLCGAYGWVTENGRKHVWGRIDWTRAEAPGSIPRPRTGSTDTADA